MQVEIIHVNIELLLEHRRNVYLLLRHLLRRHGLITVARFIAHQIAYRVANLIFYFRFDRQSICSRRRSQNRFARIIIFVRPVENPFVSAVGVIQIRYRTIDARRKYVIAELARRAQFIQVRHIIGIIARRRQQRAQGSARARPVRYNLFGIARR